MLDKWAATKTGPVEMQRIANNNEFKTIGIVINRNQKISRDRVKNGNIHSQTIIRGFWNIGTEMPRLIIGKTKA